MSLPDGLRRSCEKVARSIVCNLQHNWKHVSFICDKNSIVSVGWNQPNKTHPLAFKYGYRYSCIHSELAAILNFEYPIVQLRKHRIVNIRIDKFGKLKLSRPCSVCQTVLFAFNIKEVWYTTKGGTFESF